ncbi:MAG: hypothetical protein A2X49_16530 [Lentisphaerae bacterium GWF2_52_8]|nr:MAG: hypothetical protein A2X49_16530 [Lentisphaerae bacterium GWF2_52_8]
MDQRRERLLFWAALTGLAAIVGICTILLFFSHAKFSSDISSMLPKDSDARRILGAMQAERLTGKIAIELRLKDGAAPNLLSAAADELVPRLKHPAIGKIVCGAGTCDTAWLRDLYLALPALADQELMQELERRLSPEGIRDAMRKNFVLLSTPGGLGASEFIASDPLGLRQLLLPRLSQMSKAFNYRFDPLGRYFIGPDGRRLLILCETNLSMTDSAGARSLLDCIDKELGSLPPQVSGRAVSVLRHAAANEEVLMRDIWVLSFFALGAFSVMYFFIYRMDARSLFILAVPSVAILMSMTLLSLVMDSIPSFVFGLGGVIAGIADDYAIHVYAACRSRDSKEEMRELITPLCFCALTTLAVFALFLFSGVSGYACLGAFAILSIAFSLLLSLFVLPPLLGRKEGLFDDALWNFSFLGISPKNAKVTLVVWGVFMLASLIIAALGFSFSRSVKLLDGTPESVFKQEAEFKSYWIDGEPKALAVLRAPDRQELLRSGENFYRDASSLLGADKLISAVPLLPSQETVRKNIERWNAAMTPEKVLLIRDEIFKRAKENGFTPAAFVPFIEFLSRPAQTETEDSILPYFVIREFIRQDASAWKMYFFFPDTEENYAKLKPLCGPATNIGLISYRKLESDAGNEVFLRLGRYMIIASALIFLLTLAALRSLSQTLLAMLPTMSSLLGIAAAFAILRIPFGIPHCIAAVLVVGLSVYYGIFMAFCQFKGLKSDMTPSLVLAALTTVVGGAIVIVARHPILFGLGIVIAIGISVACLVSITVIPAIGSLIRSGGGAKKIFLLLALPTVIFLHGCSTPLSEIVKDSPLCDADFSAEYSPPEKNAYSVLASLQIEFCGHVFPMLAMLEVNPAIPRIALVGLQKPCIRLLELVSENGGIKAECLIPQVEKKSEFATRVAHDLENICLNLNPPGRRVREGGVESVVLGNIVWRFDAASGLLLKKECIEDGVCRWKISFYRYRLDACSTVPGEILLESFQPGYTIWIRVRDFKWLNQDCGKK